MVEQEVTSSPLGRSPRPRVLLIEDDPGDAYVVRVLFESGSRDFGVTWAHDISEATAALVRAEFDCALLDLGLLDSWGLATLDRLHEVSPRTAVVVLTGPDERLRGERAVALGAPDYLTKATVSRESLKGSIRSAIARQRGEETARRLRDAELFEAENARLERGLLARPILPGAGLRWATRYQPGGRRALPCGDFYDAIQPLADDVALPLLATSSHRSG